MLRFFLLLCILVWCLFPAHEGARLIRVGKKDNLLRCRLKLHYEFLVHSASNVFLILTHGNTSFYYLFRVNYQSVNFFLLQLFGFYFPFWVIFLNLPLLSPFLFIQNLFCSWYFNSVVIFYLCSCFSCCQSSWTAEPHVGFFTTWHISFKGLSVCRFWLSQTY